MDGVVLTTARLRLRQFTGHDAAFLVALLNDPDFLRYIGDRGVRSETDALGYLAAGPLASYAQHGFGLWCCERLDTGQPIGMCGVLRRETLPHPDVGYAMLPEARGHGYAREAVLGVLNFARDILCLTHVVAIVSPANERSLHLLDTLGYEREEMVVMSPGADPVWLLRPRTSQS
jgi:ribosomal-protein-alanine N-acetyltransferase